jgi:hypothetical protein
MPILVGADFAQGGLEGVIDGFIGGTPLDEKEFPSDQGGNGVNTGVNDK